MNTVICRELTEKIPSASGSSPKSNSVGVGTQVPSPLTAYLDLPLV